MMDSAEWKLFWEIMDRRIDENREDILPKKRRVVFRRGTDCGECLTCVDKPRCVYICVR